MKYLFIFFFFFQICSISAIGQEYKYHSVKAGENISSIARSYNISEEAIYKYNPDAREGVDVSTKLVIPLSETKNETEINETEESQVNFTTHKVARKETLYSLSKQYNVEIDQIKRYNQHLYAKELQRGEEIRIPLTSRETTTVEKSDNQAAAQTTPQDREQITETREHVVLPKETKYGIARKYGLTVKELEALNPKVDVLQPGVMLKVGTDVLDEPVILMNEALEFYKVKPKETLYSLSRRFGVEQDSLIALNPALEDGLKAGMVLKVPDRDEGIGNLGENETEDFQSPDEEEEEIVEEFKKIDLTRELSNFDTKELVLMLPYNLEATEADSLDTYQDAILNGRVLRISLDFYSGVLLAIEEARELGISTNLRIYDTKQNAQEVSRIISSNDFRNVDAVIGPLLQTTTETAASRLQGLEVPVISPLSNKSMRPTSNLFQSRPTEEMLTDAMVNYLDLNARDKNVIIIADRAAYQIKNKLRRVLPQARIIDPNNGHISESNLSKVLSETKENWVVLESSSVGVLTSATSALNRLARNYDISLFTTNKNNSYENDNVSNDHLGRLNFHYPSVDKEFHAEESKEFIEEYKEEYGIVPNQYAIRGYDLTLDILLRLATAENLYTSFEKNRGFTEYNENKFRYKSRSQGGFYNDAVYIMRVNPDLTLSVVNNDSEGNL